MTKKPKDPTKGHTPRPWKVRRNRWLKATHYSVVPARAGLHDLAVAVCSGKTGREAEANALLIVESANQAPALLAENKRLREAALGALEALKDADPIHAPYERNECSVCIAGDGLRAALAQSESKEAKS